MENKNLLNIEENTQKSQNELDTVTAEFDSERIAEEDEMWLRSLNFYYESIQEKSA